MNPDNKNFILAIALSVAIIMAWQFFYAQPELERQRRVQQAEQSQQQNQQQPQAGQQQPGAADVPQVGAGTAPEAAPPAATAIPVAEALAQSPRVKIRSETVSGSINLTGGRFDDLHLRRYRETVDPKSPTITLLAPANAKGAYFTEQGWAAGPGSKIKVPTPQTVWTAPADAELTPQSPVTLTWDNGEGVTFKKTISLDNDYLFTVKQEIENKTGNAVVLYPYARVQRRDTPDVTGIWVLHEGPIGVLDGQLQEHSYDDLLEDPKKLATESTGGWVGITDKYWAVTVMPAQDSQVTGTFFARKSGTRDLFQADYLVKSGVTVPPGETGSYESHVFSGAKVVRIIDGYEAKFGFDQFELLIDWGWFYFITKPLFWLIDWIQSIVKNFGVSILIATVLIKLAFFPLANKSYKSMAQMKKLQPEMMRIREQFGDDKQRQQKEMMELYRKEKVSPLSGCLPILVQIPVFFALYKVLFVTIEMRHAPFYLWIRDLSAPDPTTIFNLFGLIPWTPPAIIPLVGVLPLLMGITMWIQMKLNPAPPDPTQAMIFNWMPVIFTFLLASFPAGLVLYWAWNNFLSILQQYTIMKRQGAEINLIANIRDSLPFLKTKKAE